MDQNRESEMEEQDLEKYGRVKARSMEQGPIAMGQGTLWVRYPTLWGEAGSGKLQPPRIVIYFLGE